MLMSLYYVIILSLLIIEPCNCSSSSSSSPGIASVNGNNNNDDNNADIKVLGVLQDPFVCASPLIVAAVCSDGVAIIAAHTVSINEPLIMNNNIFAADNNIRQNNDAETTTTIIAKEEKEKQSISSSVIDDLPSDYEGPYRISVIDNFGTSIVCAGWRADCELLTTRCRSVAATETRNFGKPKQGSIHYGSYLSREASFWLAQCAVSENIRPMSCAALLASCGESPNSSPGGNLWLVDATGAYHVKAHAIGGGLMMNDSKATTVATVVNTKLDLINFKSLTVKDGVAQIIQILTGREGDDDKPSSSSSSSSVLPQGTKIEIGILDATKKSMMRLKLLSLLNGLTSPDKE